MNSSYKIALTTATMLCLVVVGYYAWPEQSDANDTVAGPAQRAATTPEAERTPSTLRTPNRQTSAANQAQAERPAPQRETPDQSPATADRHPTPPAPDRTAHDEPSQMNAPPAEDLDILNDSFARLPATDPQRAVTPSAVSQPDPPQDTPDRSPEPNQVQPTEPEPEAQPQPQQAPSPSPTTARDSGSPTTTRTTYTVASGDTLSSIAQELYGEERYWVEIARANPTIDPLRLRIGQELRLPSRDAIESRTASQRDSDLESPPGTTTHTVRAGETLSTIAQRHYNDSARWRIIYNANRDKIGSDPNRLSAGDELTIPPLPRGN